MVEYWRGITPPLSVSGERIGYICTSNATGTKRWIGTDPRTGESSGV